MAELLDFIGWNQAQFARRVGVSERTVSRWVKGNPDPVAIAYLELVARLLGKPE
jgi:transcriptional regulator with XRE-family HTH domain